MKRPTLIALAAILALTGAGLVIREQFGLRRKTPILTNQAHAEKPESHRTQPIRPSRMPAVIATLTDPSLQLPLRLEEVRKLPDDLTNPESAELMDLVRGPAPQRLRPDNWYVIANEIMNVLRETRFHIDGYSIAMAGIVADKKADPVIRDYAAQHLALTLDRVAHKPKPADFQLVMETFLKVVSGKDEAFHDVTGTILMSLTAVASTFHPDDLAPYRERLESEILSLVSGERKSSMSNRISAIQVAGRLGVIKALPAIRDLARGNAPNPSIQLSSVAALGYFHQPEDRRFIEDLAANDKKLHMAAVAALRNYPPR